MSKKVTLLAINAKYVHSSLAVWFLANGVSRYSRVQHDVTVVEAVIGQDFVNIAERVIADKPDVIGISVYIWNVSKLPLIIKHIRNYLPKVILVIGGPEVSCNAEYWLKQNVDYVICGKGEESFPMLLDVLSEDNADLKRPLETLPHISGLSYMHNGKIYENKQVEPSIRYKRPLETAVAPSQHSFPIEPSTRYKQHPKTVVAPSQHSFPDAACIDPYSDEYFNTLNGRIAYIETSRGCPFNCSYCLSGEGNVEFFPLETVKEQIYKLSQTGTKTLKFIDRTFNCNAERAYELIKYIINLDADCCFHFEIAADLLNESLLSILSTAKPGKIQIETGIQSFHEPTLKAISRQTNIKKAEKNIRTLLKSKNIHIHVDLIAGLPYETLSDFKKGFNRIYALNPHKIQLGFLKLLHGSKLRQDAEIYNIVYDKKPPYEIISNPWMNVEDFKTLKQTENALQHTYNKGRFLATLQYVLSTTGVSPFSLYQKLGESVENHAMPLEIYTERLYECFAKLPNVNAKLLRDNMICDLLCTVKGKNIPNFLKTRGKQRKDVVKKAKQQLHRPIDYDETAVLSTGKGVYIDSNNRDLVTKLYEIVFL